MCDYNFKYVLLGHRDSGKTKFIKTFVYGKNPTSDVPLALDFLVKRFFFEDKYIKAQLCDTAGQERFRSLYHTYLRGAHGALVVYDMSRQHTFDYIKVTLDEIIIKHVNDGVQMILVGNKCNKHEEKVITTEEGKQLAQKYGILFIEASGTEDIDVKCAFDELTRAVLAKNTSPSASFLEQLRQLDPKSVSMFKQAMLTGSEKVHEIRIMVAGHYGVGKTTLTRGILKETTPREQVTSTDGIDIYVGYSEIDLRTKKWILGNSVSKGVYKKLAKLLHNIDPEKNVKVKDGKVEKDTNLKQNENKSIWRQITDFFSRQKIEEETCIAKSNMECLPPEHFLKKTLDHAKDDHSKETAPVQVWDFGGQVVFYTTHQTFLSVRCIYLLVFDLRKGLHDIVDDIDLIPGKQTKPETLAFLFFWVNSIITYAGGRYLGFPKIVFIGTHLDQLPENTRTEIVNNTFSSIQDSFKDHYAYDHLVIDPKLSLNTHDIENGTYDKIRNNILEIAALQPFWGEERPTSWLSFEETLTNLRLSGTNFLTLTQIKILNNANLVHVMSDQELEAFLKFQHCKGNILFFPEQSLRDFVILHPVWLVDALKTFITAEKFCISDTTKAEMWENASKRGILSHATIEILWQKAEYKEFYENKEDILNAMERLDLITVPKKYSSEGENTHVEYYLVPSMILNLATTEDLEAIIPTSRSVCMFVTSRRCFLPPAIFHRLVASCLTMWPLLQHKNESMLFSGFCGLRLDSFHRLFLQQRQYQILVHICHTRDLKAISRTLCLVFKDFIMLTLERITEVYSQYYSEDEKHLEHDKEKGGLFEIEIPCCALHLDCLLTDRHHSEPDCQHHDISNQMWLSDFKQTKCLTGNEFDDKEDCSPDCKGLDKIIMQRQPTDQDLCRLSRHLLSPPDILGTALDVPVEVIDNIRCSPYYGKHEQNFYLLHHWRNRGKTNFRTLMEALSITRDTSKHILCNIHKVQSHQTATGLLGQKYLQRPSVEDIDFISDRITPTEAFQLGIELGLTLVQIEDIRFSHPNNSLKQKREMLYKWRQMSTTGATYGALSEALCQIGASSAIMVEILHQQSEDDEI